MDEIIIRIPVESKHGFSSFWKEVRSAEGYNSDSDLKEAEELSRFDGASLAEWVLPLTEALPAILTGVLGYLVARRGEIEIDGMKFRNVTAKQVREILAILDEYEQGKRKK